jgi:hypothetical protein
MDDRQKMRASDHDRQEVVDRLRGALEDGRLKMDEFADRVGLAYQAVTYGDLAPLHADLPAAGSRPEREAAPPALAPPACVRWQDVAGLPVTLKVLWTIWLTAVSINVMVWALVSGTTAHLVYPWPLWVAGPYGTALLAVSVGVTRFRRRCLSAERPEYLFITALLGECSLMPLGAIDRAGRRPAAASCPAPACRSSARHG